LQVKTLPIRIMLYFAYGSTMSVHRLLHRVPSAVAVDTGYLYKHTLVFHKPGRKDGSGKCDAYETGRHSDFLMGVVYRINSAHKHLLDKVEGRGNGYEVKHVPIRTCRNREVSAFTYYATKTSSDLLPFHWYKEHVLYGAREHGLSPEYIQKIISTESVQDPNSDRAKEELSIYNG
jgi:cation transport regulator ChaC